MTSITSNIPNMDGKYLQSQSINVFNAFKNGGVDGIGNYLNGQLTSVATGMVDGAVNEMFGDSVLGSVVGGVVSAIISAILSGDFSAPKGEIEGAAKSLEEAKNMQNFSDQVGKALNGEGKQIVDANKLLQQNYEQSMNELLGNTNSKVAEMNDQLGKYNTTKDETNDTMKANNDLISQKMARIKDIDEELAKFKEQGGVLPEPKPKKDGEGGDEGTPQLTGNPEIDKLLAEKSLLGGEILNLQAANVSLASVVVNSGEETKAMLTETSQVSSNATTTAEQEADMLLQGISQGKAALTEFLSIVDKGLMPQFDKAMLKKITTLATKATINGTNSGLLAGIASALGVGSIFSFGSTAMQAKNAGQGSAMYGTASAADVFNSALEKTIHQQLMSYFKQQIISPLTDKLGLNNELGQFALSNMADIMNNIDNTYNPDLNTTADDVAETIDENADETEEIVEESAPA